MPLLKRIATLPLWMVALIILLLAYPCAFGITEAYKQLIWSQKAMDLTEFTQRQAIAVSNKTVNGNVMGGAALMGVMNESLKKTALGELPPDSPQAMEGLQVLVEEYDAGNAFVVNNEGIIVAYKRARSKKTGTGKSLLFRPYFQQAIKGIPNVYAALGISTGQRGLYFASPIYRGSNSNSEIIGVVAIKIKPDSLENLLAKSGKPALLLSPQKVVYATNKPEWLFRVGDTITPEVIEGLNRYMQFGKKFTNSPPKPLGFDVSHPLTTIDTVQYAVSTFPVKWNDPLGDWTLVILENTDRWFSSKAFHGLNLALFILLLVLFTAFYVASKGRYFNQLYSDQLAEKQLQLASKSILLETVLNSILQGLVAYDKDLRLIVCNRRFQEVRDVPDQFARMGCSFEEWMRYDINRDEFAHEDPQTKLEDLVSRAKQFVYHKYERTRSDGSILEIEGGPLPGGGFVSTFSDITERKRLEAERNEALEIIESSIRYASLIQQSILPSSELMEELFPNSFVLWEPRDVVGGDIYWAKKWGEGRLVMLGDCTGHGVPGAFMSLIANGALEQAFNITKPGDCAALISNMHRNIQIALGQDKPEGDSDDGLELGACYLSLTDSTSLTFAGARFSLFKQTPGKREMTEIKSDKKGIGYRRTPFDYQFTNLTVTVTPQQRIFLVTDGLTDQIGGKKKRGFGKNRVKRGLLELESLPIQEVGKTFYKKFNLYQGDEKRRDDVSLIGFMV
ncbi:MAG: PAS-domain containing protein [Magnetococcales bacterium]|nr:PAS-domain containing protein [Magnetococcales bacterium]